MSATQPRPDFHVPVVDQEGHALTAWFRFFLSPRFRAMAADAIRITEGANARQGMVTLVAGTATVGNTNVTATSRIFLTSQSDGGTPGFLRVSARTPGVSFTITSSSNTDTSTVAYEIFEPA